MKKTLLFLISILYITQLASTVIAEYQQFRPFQKSWELDLGTQYYSIDLSPSGQFIVTLSNSEIKVLDIKNGDVLRKINTFDAFGMRSDNILTNGDYIVVNGRHNGNFSIMVFDKDLKNLWEYNDKIEIAVNGFGPSYMGISLDGKNIISTVLYPKPDKEYMTIIYFIEDKTLGWKKEFTGRANDFTISSTGDVIGVKLTETGFSRNLIVDKNGQILNDIRKFKLLSLSADGKTAVALKEFTKESNKVVYYNFDTGSDIWEFNYNEGANSLDQTSDSKNIVVGFNNLFYILNEQGNLNQKYDLDEFMKGIQISSNGKYLLMKKYSSIVVFSNDIPVIRSPEEKAIIENKSLMFNWEDNGAASYFIRIDNEISEISGNELILNRSLSEGEHEWSLKSNFRNGNEGLWSYPRKLFYYRNPVPYLTYPNDNMIFKSDNLSFNWDYKGNAKKYEINISGKIYESLTKEFSISADSFQHGTYQWSIKAIKMDDSESEWSLPRTFSINAPEEKIVKKEVEVLTPLNPGTIITIGILIIGVFVIFIRPYYKRARLQKEMAKTPTDWCPHCKKFTGGAAICPHCGLATNKEKKYDTSKKVTKK
jgi:hypothetical protein